MALREVNLYPEDLLYWRYVKRHLCFWACCLGGLFAVVGGYHLIQRNILLSGRHSAFNLTSMNRELALKTEKIAKIKTDLESLLERHRAFNGLSNPVPYSWVLTNLSGKMNGSTWLSTLSVEGEKNVAEGTRVMMRGYAFENAHLGDFLNQLAADSLFKDVLLRYARETKLPLPGRGSKTPVDMIEFEIQFRIATEPEA